MRAAAKFVEFLEELSTETLAKLMPALFHRSTGAVSHETVGHRTVGIVFGTG
jgi:hypothetical protein